MEQTSTTAAAAPTTRRLSPMASRNISFQHSELRIRKSDDDDYINTLMCDAARTTVAGDQHGGGGGSSSTQTNTKAAGAIAAKHVAEGVLEDLAYNTPTPVEWTPGYRISPKGTSYGNTQSEGGWGVDPAAMAIVSNNIHRVISLKDTRMSREARTSVQRAYINSVKANQETVLQAYKIRYEFQPRPTEAHRFPSPSTEAEARDPARGTSLSLQAFAMPWSLSVQYEIVSRYFDRMWGALSATREQPGSYSPPQIMHQLKQTHLIFYGHDVPQQFLAQFLNEYVDFVSQEMQDAAHVREGALRLIMRARNIDSEKKNLAYIYRGSLSESAILRGNHRMVEDEILRSLWYNAQQLRYMFRYEKPSLAPTKSRGLGLHEYFRYRIGRAIVSKSARDTEKIAQMKQNTGDITAQQKNLEYGIRVVIPPAPQGYLRNNVLIAFRSRATDNEVARMASYAPEEARKEKEEIVHIIAAGAIPDTSVWFDDDSGSGGGAQEGASSSSSSARNVSELPASFVMYHSRASDGRNRAHKKPEGHHGYIMKRTDDGGESEAIADVWWEAVYDLKWLDYASGYRPGDSGSPINNDILHTAFQSLYAYPFRSSAGATAIGAYRKRYTKPWIQVFVEYVPMEDTLSEMRRDRAKWIKQVSRGGAQPHSESRVFDPPRSFTGLKESLPMAPWTKGDRQKKFRDLPVIEDFAQSLRRKRVIMAQSDAEISRFGETLEQLQQPLYGSTMTTPMETITTTASENIDKGDSKELENQDKKQEFVEEDFPEEEFPEEDFPEEDFPEEDFPEEEEEEHNLYDSQSAIDTYEYKNDQEERRDDNPAAVAANHYGMESDKEYVVENGQDTTGDPPDLDEIISPAQVSADMERNGV